MKGWCAPLCVGRGPLLLQRAEPWKELESRWEALEAGHGAPGVKRHFREFHHDQLNARARFLRDVLQSGVAAEAVAVNRSESFLTKLGAELWQRDSLSALAAS